MPTELDLKIAAVKTTIEQARTAAAAAEHRQALAGEAAKQAEAALREEFGVTTVAEAKDKLTGLEREVEAECSRVVQLLTVAERRNGDGSSA